MKKRVAIYCRIDRGGPQSMIKAQIVSLKRYAKTHKMQVVRCYQDTGQSGSYLERPGLNQMIADYADGNFDTVLVAERTRIFRGSMLNKLKLSLPIISANPIERAYNQEEMR